MSSGRAALPDSFFPEDPCSMGRGRSSPPDEFRYIPPDHQRASEDSKKAPASLHKCGEDPQGARTGENVDDLARLTAWTHCESDGGRKTRKEKAQKQDVESDAVPLKKSVEHGEWAGTEPRARA